MEGAMVKWFKIALRNIVKNRRRSLVTLLAVSLGFSAVSLFYGYTSFTYKGLRNAAIHGEGLGHLTLYKSGWLENGRIEPDRYMFSKEELQRVLDLVRAEEKVILATPQIYISGLVTNSKISTIFIGKGVVPADETIIRGPVAEFWAIQGAGLSSEKGYQVEMASDLAGQLSLAVNDDAVVMGSTLDGQMNALDITVGGIYDTGVAATNDKFIRFPFTYAQQLYDTEKADRIVVLLADWKITEFMQKRLQQKLAAAGIDTEIKNWYQLSAFYRQVKGLFNMIFVFIFSIVFVIVVMSVINTMGMAVVERTREIGTLRALGLKRGGVSLLFAMEGAMLGLLGSGIGIVLFFVIWFAFKGIKPMYLPPGSSSPVPMVIDLVPLMIAALVVFLSLLSTVAAIIPARKAGRQSIVDALAHV